MSGKEYSTLKDKVWNERHISSELFCCFVFVAGSEFRRSELLCSDPAVDEEEGWERGDILNDRELAEILSNGEGL